MGLIYPITKGGCFSQKLKQVGHRLKGTVGVVYGGP